MKLFATRHSHAELYVHLVWATRRRAAVLDRRILQTLRGQSIASARAVGAVVVAFGGVADHVHVLLRYRPDLSVATLARGLKAALTHKIRNAVPELGDFSWQAGYGAFSVARSDVDRVAAYVADQVRHHAGETIWPIWDIGG